jgi:hypothetical protein
LDVFVWKDGTLIVGGQTRKNDRKEKGGAGSEIKQNNYIYQHITPISAPKIQELIQLLEGVGPPLSKYMTIINTTYHTAAREDPTLLSKEFPPLPVGKKVPMGDVFTSCNWVLRDECVLSPSPSPLLLYLLPLHLSLPSTHNTNKILNPHLIPTERPKQPPNAYS